VLVPITATKIKHWLEMNSNKPPYKYRNTVHHILNTNCLDFVNIMQLPYRSNHWSTGLWIFKAKNHDYSGYSIRKHFVQHMRNSLQKILQQHCI